jgi:hypothetical protein
MNEHIFESLMGQNKSTSATIHGSEQENLHVKFSPDTRAALNAFVSSGLVFTLGSLSIQGCCFIERGITVREFIRCGYGHA